MSHIHEFLKVLPKSEFCFAYGSSYLKSIQEQDPNRQIDLVISVKNPLEWHSENLKSNPNHYSSLTYYLKSSFIVKSSKKAAGIHYNPFVHYGESQYKYGVISTDDLILDLSSWETFYLAGRLQKPVEIVLENTQIQDLMLKNYHMGAIAGLLMVPSLSSEVELYQEICKLSYYGDKRLEDPNKINNIVQGNLKRFNQIYVPVLKKIEGIEFENGVIQRLPHFYNNLASLPEWIKSYQHISEMESQDRRALLIDLFTRRNAYYSKKQIFHALKTTSFSKLFRYSFAKLTKSLKYSILY